MKRTLAIAIACLFAVAATALAELHGSWTANTIETKPGRVQMNISSGGSHNFGNSMNVANFTGLSDAQIRGAAQVPVQFQLLREGGTVSFEGSFKNGDGAGQWTFAPNRGYIASLRSLGVKFDLDGDSEEENLFTVALLDVSTAYIRSMQAIGYDGSLEKYLSMRIFKVTPELVAELRELGFDHLSADELVSTRVHKVTPEFIRKMRSEGFTSLTLDELMSFRIHKVTSEFIAELRDLGYDHLTADQLVSMRIFKVTPQYIRDLKDAGYSGIPVQKLIDMKIHKIDLTRRR
jgi:hypothetical protein